MSHHRLKLTRAQLGAFLNDHESIKQFEKLFQIVDENVDDIESGSSITGDSAGLRANEAVALVLALAQSDGLNLAVSEAKINQALSDIGRMANALELLAMAPSAADGLTGGDVSTPDQPGQSHDDVAPPNQPADLIDSDATINGDLTLPKTSGKGIRVDKVDPSFGWRDILAEPFIRVVGANDPAWNVYRDTIRQFEFSAIAMNEVWAEYHVPHDYVPGTDLHAHVHWSQNVVDTGGAAASPGTVKWYFDVTYSKGHGTPGGAADAFGATITTSVAQQGSTTQYGHMIAETVITDDGAALIDRSRIEPDGVFLLRVYRDPADAADTLNQTPFMHFSDLHYQSTNMATKQKAPDFYT